MEQEVRHILESVTADRASALEQVQASRRQSRPTSKTEIDRWLRASRP